MEWWAILLVTAAVLLFLAACEDWGATDRRIKERIQRDATMQRVYHQRQASLKGGYWVDMTKVGR